ncbi:MAG: HD family phosphohydrolase [Candidatus Omnitrophica bacterium CG_4_9_14_0_2_um_filter_42_8]|nr:MAG: HD family phosphohydrolase [Candidatus Omnitrophica bacterium CG22_combo_CG10-13_8_21_14_all_43_16]PJC48364.1 MAG: HD family phosphohydrolase [Candidatus Omnitrophica bacterium CG_4_9_14_0_2_um_filter_42_8]
MAHRFINDLKEGETVESIYLVREKSFDITKKGDSYIALELSDKTGMVDCRKWDALKSLFDSFSVDDFVKVKARVEFFRNYPQLKIDSIEKTDDKSVDISLYLPVSDKNRDKMFRDFLSEMESVKNPYLKALINSVFTDKDISEKFKTAPAASDFHHPYIGGLLEHTLACVELARLLASKYRDIDLDLLLCGTALHDIGKIYELSYKRSFYYTDKGRLIGHIVLGVNIVNAAIDNISEFPEELKNLILHIMLSHHGEQEWGSPKRPMCFEAIILHHIDNLDAKINGFRHFVKTYSDPDSSWTKHSKMFGELLYKKSEVKHEEKEG